MVAALREEGRLRAEEPYTHSVPFSHRSGERIEPLISLQWFCRMDELAKPAIEAVERDEVRIAPGPVEARLPRLDAGDPPLVRLAPALVGAPDPGLVLRRLRGDYRRRAGARALRRLRRRAAPGGGRARHLVQLGALALRHARLARRHARAARLLPDQLPHHRPRDPLPLGGADGDDGARVRRRRPLPRRLRALGDPGPRRAADVEEPRHRDRPAGGDRRPRRRRPALRPAGDVLDPGRALLRRQGRAGPRPRQQALEREPADPAQRRRGVEPAPRPLHVEDRWILSRLERTIASVTEKLEAYDFAHAVQEAYSFFWRDLCDWYLEIVKPRLYDGEEEVSATLLYALERVLALLHPTMPFVTEEIWSFHPARARPPRRPPVPGRRRVALRRGRRGRRRGRDRADPAPARLARPRRRAGRGGPGGGDRRGRAAASSSAASPASSSTGSAPSRSPRSARCGCSPPTQLDAEAVAARLDKRREELRGRGRAGRAQTRQRGLRRQGPGRGGRGGARQARALPGRTRRAGCAELRPGRLPRLAGADRLAARPGADAQADDGAGAAPAPLRLDPRRRHQRQVLGGADDGGAAGGARGRRRRLPLARTPPAGRSGR